MKALVSIIIPTYNRAKLLEETLCSVVNQTYSHWECIIIDDFSTDDTDRIVDSFRASDSRFTYLKKDRDAPKGASASRNMGIMQSKGDYIQFLDSDDILASNKIEEQIKLLESESIFSIVTCKWELFSNNQDQVSITHSRPDYQNFYNPKDYFDLIGEHGGFFPPICYLVSKSLLNFSGYWNESLSMNDDGEFFFRIISNSKKILFAENTYALYRKNIANDVEKLSALNSENKAYSLVQSWKIIESLYQTKYSENDSKYLNKKKESVYFELQRTYPQLIKRNYSFFENQLKKDNFLFKFNKLKKRIRLKWSLLFNKNQR